MYAAIRHFFAHDKLTKGLNHTFIALIPKLEGDNRVEQFRPIALCNVSFKLITKIITTRLRTILEKVVYPTQVAFIPNRNITDNTILNHEIMHYMNGRKGKTAYMAPKIDTAKAYNKVDWHVVLKLLEFHGFASHFCNLVKECLSTSTFSILLNGSPYGSFKSSRGIRQGDPLSPALFTIFFDLMSQILNKAEGEGRIKGIKVSNVGPVITHLMYADDLVIYGRAHARKLLKSWNALTFSARGHDVNLAKYQGRRIYAPRIWPND